MLISVLAKTKLALGVNECIFCPMQGVFPSSQDRLHIVHDPDQDTALTE